MEVLADAGGVSSSPPRCIHLPSLPASLSISSCSGASSLLSIRLNSCSGEFHNLTLWLETMRKITYLNEINKVLERGVEMCLFSQLHYFGEMLVVDVSVDSEQPLQDGLCD